MEYENWGVREKIFLADGKFHQRIYMLYVIILDINNFSFYNRYFCEMNLVLLSIKGRFFQSLFGSKGNLLV